MSDGALPDLPVAEDAGERAARAFDAVGSWLLSGPMGELLDRFGTPDDEVGEAGGGGAVTAVPPAQATLLRRSFTIERAATAAFNFRHGGDFGYAERSQARVATFDEPDRVRIRELTAALGLVHVRAPRRSSYDRTLVLGGGYRSPLLRASHAARLQAAGIHLSEVSFLGSPRPLINEPPEWPATVDYAPGASDEFGLLVGAVRAVFGVVSATVTFRCGCLSDDHPCPRWAYHAGPGAGQTCPPFTHERQATLVGRDGRSVGSVLSPSTTRPPYRPSVADAMNLWIRCAEPRPGAQALLVTGPAFVPFQTFDAIRSLYLPRGIGVEAVGHRPDPDGRPTTAEYLLQETLSAIRSARRVLVAAAEVLAAGPDRQRG